MRVLLAIARKLGVEAEELPPDVTDYTNAWLVDLWHFYRADRRAVKDLDPSY